MVRDFLCPTGQPLYSLAEKPITREGRMNVSTHDLSSKSFSGSK